MTHFPPIGRRAAAINPPLVYPTYLVRMGFNMHLFVVNVSRENTQEEIGERFFKAKRARTIRPTLGVGVGGEKLV